MRPLVLLLLAFASLLFISGVAATSSNRATLSLPDGAIAIWDGEDSQSEASPAPAPDGEDLARYAQLENSGLHEALAVAKPDAAMLPLAITPFSSTE